MIVFGVVLVYSGIKKIDPRDVVRKALNKESKFGFFGISSGPNATRDIIPLPRQGGGSTPKFTSIPGAVPIPLVPNV